MGSACLVHLSNVLPSASDEKMTGQQGGSAAERDAPAIVEHFPQKTYQQGKNARPGGEKHAVQGVDARAESFGDAVLDGGASQNGAVAAEKAADGAVDQHQRIGQPEQAHVHSHIIILAVNLDCDRKFRNFWGSSKAIRRLSDTLCIQNGLSIIEQPKGHSKSYNKWLGNEAKTSQRDGLREALDAALAHQPKDFEELLTMLQRGGWEVKRGKRISLKGKGQERFKRLDSLGEDYSEAALRAIIAGEKEHHPREKKTVQPMRQVNLLVDIQAKLQAGKGAGFERWAKVFNLKQMAQTLNYLSENNLMNIEDLTAKTDAAIARVHELQVTIRETEKRMAELHALKGHIINYVKTREVYVAYRMAGYSKKFVAEHEQEIKLHQAAKEAFSALGTQKIPKVKEIQAEYDVLREKKKQAYAAYHQAQDEMRQLLTVRANVERILGVEEKEKERQKEKKKER